MDQLSQRQRNERAASRNLVGEFQCTSNQPLVYRLAGNDRNRQPGNSDYAGAQQRSPSRDAGRVTFAKGKPQKKESVGLPTPFQPLVPMRWPAMNASVKSHRERNPRRPLVVLLLCAILLSACSRDPDDQKHKFFNKAAELLKKGNTEAAALELQNALKIDPNYAEAGNILAEMRFRQGNHAEAYALLRRISEASPDYLPARQGLVRMYQLGGKFAEAQHEAEYILERSPDDIDALFDLGTAQASQKMASEAEGTFNRILEIQPSHVNTLMALAALRQDAKDLPAAEHFYRIALERNPRSVQVYMALIGFYISTSRPLEADPLFADALKVSNNNVGILQAQISYYVDLGRLAEAEDLVKKIQSSHLKDPKYWGALADFYVQVNQWDQAKVELQRVLQLHDDAASVSKLVEVYLSLNDRKSAETLNDAVLKKNPKDAHAHLVKGRLYLADGDANNALFQFNETKKYEPDLPALHYWYAQAHLQRGELEQAAEALDQALQFDPDYETARVELAELQNRMGAAEVALSNAKKVLLKHPGNVRAMLAYSQALTTTKDFAGADKVLKIVTQRVPTNAEAHRQLGVLNLVSKNLPAARNEFKEASNLQPGSKALLEEVLLGYVAEKQTDAAIEFLQKEIQGSALKMLCCITSWLRFTCCKTSKRKRFRR